MLNPKPSRPQDGALLIMPWIVRADLQSQPDALFAFGDNEGRYGLGGQAREMRGEPNAVGIATLKAPGVFWSDDEADRQCAVIDADMAPLFAALADGRTVIWPADGVGSGLADLQNRSPKTWAHLQARVAELKTQGGV